ncbi:YjgB family protein [Cohnella sp. REN36]|uniref:YjgB family protein n=1 Tax=Cohnella sp. REN36 TaxID=2887347 RepID=UPI001D159354|nr:YjgB family protein [Cohnella sp. REN36]MCC3371609.1 YjgB family protein [Cohnella sp. REN36]
MKANLNLKTIAVSLAVSGVLVLSACSAGGDGAASPPASAVGTATPEPSTAPSGTPDGSPTPPAPPVPSASPTGSASSPSGAVDRELKELMKLAKEGRVPGIDYAAHSGLIDDVERDWGKADATETAGKGIYATYGKHRAAFGFNKGSQIFDVRSSDPQLQALTLKEIEHSLGKPTSTAKNGDDAIYVYQANKQFQLKFVIPKKTGKVDHISVFSPQDAVNNMAG